jgi:hypothetical protein
MDFILKVLSHSLTFPPFLIIPQPDNPRTSEASKEHATQQDDKVLVCKKYIK